MKNLEKTLLYHELSMTYSDTSKIQKYDLPSGYHYEFYRPGDEEEWVEIQMESGSICNSKKALEYFHAFFDYFKVELDKRCFFIVNDNYEKIATATISLLENNEDEYEATVDWVAIKSEYQGKGLSRPLISKLLEVANNLGHDKLMLHTQTHTWLAAKLYLDFGFEPYNMTNGSEGWQILKKLTNHPKLKNISSISNDKMFSKLALLIDEKLSTMFEKDYSYSIWYKNGRNDVYVYCDGKEYEYKYYEKQEAIELEVI
ncbi:MULTISPECIES: GNAT family N-acetyltransferase [unclassified Fusibacter]|uniref:GNAT family N-acetyltransferase n=1 Tax=unclassified Fusibacter TaxID=2624464 RepID=UPI0010126069|nr:MULTISPECIES: GNAT family N-acetyltransferase [unclassified Fusibacter]MCK8059494.1 GNAT family N-acetyltransferase [Fusibacter sp. A2]NPE21042.1 GNAT family N-acetyltransferase [Fusibacter sp. A1]RXV62316.1 GNAT family N-acetyltransferase [Fusibacter sp. A1]